MKKGLITLLLVAQLISLLGCGARQTASDELAVRFFYEVRDADVLQPESVVAAETRTVTGNVLRELLEWYLAGPESEELISPFPAGTQVLDVISNESGLTLIMSGEFFTLMGVEMSVASCCLASTVCECAEVPKVVLSDELGTIRLEVRPEHYLLSNDITQAADEAFTVYFSDAEHRYLIAETRAAILSENETESAYVMRQLFEGPESEQLAGIIPENAELLEVRDQDGVCIVNFSSGFYKTGMEDAHEAYLTVYGIVNTLTGLPGIQAVQFLKEGEPVERYGMFSLSEPVSRNSDAVGPVRVASGELDANIYVRSVETGEMFAVPCRVKQTVSQPLPEAVITRVLSYEAFQGFENPIPFGTELLSISVSGSVCYVDVSEKFVPPEDAPEAERAAVWALVASLTDLDNIAFVSLSVNGDSGGLNFVDISEPLTRESVALS